MNSGKRTLGNKIHVASSKPQSWHILPANSTTALFVPVILKLQAESVGLSSIWVLARNCRIPMGSWHKLW